MRPRPENIDRMFRGKVRGKCSYITKRFCESKTPGYALNVAYDRKVTGAGEQCRQQGIAFIPVVAESLGGWHPVAVEQIRKLGSALARHTGQEESEAISHLVTRCSILLQRGLTAFVLNRVPGHPAPHINGDE